jgi:hypothetical protein
MFLAKKLFFRMVNNVIHKEQATISQAIRQEVIKMSNTMYVMNRRKVRSVTRMPGFILKFKGRLDSRKGGGVCNGYICQLYKKLAALEVDEVIVVENLLFHTRKKAAVILTRFTEQERYLSGIVKLTAIHEEIINADTILDERINEMRNKAMEKIHAYITGIRCGQLREYTYEAEDISDNAREIYRKRHAQQNRKIREAVGVEMSEEDAA